MCGFFLSFLVAVIYKVSASSSIKTDFSFCNVSSFQTCSLIESSFEWHFRKCSPASEVRLQTRCSSCSPAGSVWLAASYTPVFWFVPSPFNIRESVPEKTSHARYPDLFLRRNAPKSQKQKSQKRYEAWYWWTIKSEFHLIILLCSWIHHLFQLWAHQPLFYPWASWHPCHSTDREWEIQLEKPNCPQARRSR